MPDADHLLLDPEEQRLLLRLRGPSWRGRIGEVIAILDLFEREGIGRQEAVEAVRLLAERNRGRPTVETPAGSDVSAPRPPTGTPSRRARGAPRSRGTSSAHRDLRGCRIGGEELRGRTAREVFVKVWRWLVRHGYLERERLPIRYGSRSRKRYVVAGEPVHPTGRHFVNPAEIAPGIWVETNKSQERMARELRLAFEDFGVEAELLWRP